MESFEIHSLEELIKPAKALIKLLQQNPVAAFYGEMGVGKTTFIKVLCQELGVSENISSPTFAIINEYATDNGTPIFHMDLYRLKTAEELLDIGAEEYFYSGDICLIEWPEKGEDLLPHERVNIWMEETTDGIRNIKMKISSEQL